MNKAIISMSGGLDSTCLAMYLLNQGYEVYAYAFNYGQKHKIELKKLKKNIKIFQRILNLPIKLQIINLIDAFSDSNSSLKNIGEIPKENYNNANIYSTVVENRNIIFSSIIYGKALGIANKNNEYVKISLGMHAGDHAVYPDTTKESFNAAANLFKISNLGSEKVEYIAPFIDKNKSEVLKIGLESMKNLKINKNLIRQILRNTHSCYDPVYYKSCGKCATCQERLQAFKDNNIKDPASYIKET